MKGKNEMKLGAQLYSVRTFLQNEKDLKDTFEKISNIGYENVQLSGAAQMSAEYLRDVSAEYSLPIVCTHMPYDRIINDTDALITEHRIFNCPVIGLGYMPNKYHGSLEGLKAFAEVMKEPVKKIKEAGFDFAYHNHDFEFKTDGGAVLYDVLLELCPDWQFILDTYWVEYAGHNAAEYIGKIGPGRIPNIHFKDMSKDETKSICACGDGILDFEYLFTVCEKNGVINVLVEQDNAINAPDPFAEMKKSFDHLRKITKKEGA